MMTISAFIEPIINIIKYSLIDSLLWGNRYLLGEHENLDLKTRTFYYYSFLARFYHSKFYTNFNSEEFFAKKSFYFYFSMLFYCYNRKSLKS
jgi:hypothetical protein